MRTFILSALITGTALPLLAAAPVMAAEAGSTTASSAIDAAVSADLRGEDKARDQYRHPKETLEFFQVAPNMVIAEYAADAGWYTKILAPLTVDSGKYVALGVSPTAPAFNEQRKAQMAAYPTSYPDRAAKATGIAAGKINAYVTNAVPAELNATVDRIFIFRMLHNMNRWGILGSELDAMHKMLKPGGMIGIEQHRAKADAPAAYVDGSKGYLKEADVIAMFKQHGFELVGKSEVNANPKDSADYPDGVWTLPPNYALKDQDRAKYAAIGESDRMTLLFRKK
ncbi:class I SAM-dependent methyltransferase [Blastomonas sp. SL216]|uniref:class I SAM-dependent methyltransferase n=1 Tax=Blastomonas sp. SL216 TaxID=2995169 RepID=UPI0023778DFF|nr:methyltransferase [Blastomonas sp. SL216]